MKRNNILFVFLFGFILLSSTSLSSGFGDITATIHGNVTSEAGGGIVGAKVELWKDGSPVQTDYTEDDPNTPSIVEGLYSITYTGPRLAIYYLKVSKEGYFPQESLVILRAGSIEKNFVLEIDYPAQTTFMGRVSDTQSPSNGLQNARVYLKIDSEILQKTVTDVNGYYAFDPVTHTEAVTFTLEAYKCGVRQVKTVTSSATCTKNVYFYINAGTSYAVLVGIGSFQGSWQEARTSTIRATNEWYDYLKNEMYYDEIYVYGDDVSEYTYYTALATKWNILARLIWIKNEVGPEDMVVVYFATHGSNEPCLICWNMEGRIFENDLKSVLPTNSRTFVFLSACESGAWIEPLSSTSSNEDLFIVTITSPDYNSYGALWDVFYRTILTHLDVGDDEYYYYIFNGIKYYYHQGNDISMELAYKDTYRYWEYKGNVQGELGWMWDIDNGLTHAGYLVDETNPFYL